MNCGAASITAWLVVAGGLALVGCQPTDVDEESSPPFVFRELNLRQQDSQGRPLWQINSPETRYDLSRRIAQARALTGILYRDGQPLYRLTASAAVVVNDGEVVLLEGPTRLQRLDRRQPAELTALRVRWYPSQERMEIDRSPRLVQGDLQLTAELARFLIGEERLELRRSARLQQRGAEPLRLTLGALDWQAESGALSAAGPVRGDRRLSDGSLQRISAPALSGNSFRQTLDLKAPVRLEDPAREAWLQAGPTQLELSGRTASSGSPFQGRYGRTQFSGNGFLLNLPAHTLTVRSGCQLRQPQEQLRADTCLWNWRSGEASASGRVVLQRQANGQVSRAGQLRGRIGDDGFVEFSTPGGGRVSTQLELPGSPARRHRVAVPDPGPQPQQRPPAFQL